MLSIRDELADAFLPKPGSPPVEWAISDAPVDYEDAVAEMEARAAAIAAGRARERVWLLEHPPLYTAGTSARDEDLIDPGRFPVFRSGRGGQFTYHGPGQRVAYVMLDLKRRTPGPARATWRRWSPGSSRRSARSTSAASAGRIASASGCAGPTRGRAPRTRSPPSASACGAG